jgi:hypothetical protein
MINQITKFQGTLRELLHIDIGYWGPTSGAQQVFLKQLRFNPMTCQRLLMEAQSRNMLKLLHQRMKFSHFLNIDFIQICCSSRWCVILFYHRITKWGWGWKLFLCKYEIKLKFKRQLSNTINKYVHDLFLIFVAVAPVCIASSLSPVCLLKKKIIKYYQQN